MILALPLFSKAPEISFDPGQGFPSHFLIELSPELIEKVKEAQQCVADFSFKQVGIVTNTESQAIDVSDDEFESKVALNAHSFSVSSPNIPKRHSVVHVIDRDLSNLKFLNPAHTMSPTIFVGQYGLWVEMTCTHPSMAVHFVSGAKNIQSLSAYL
jgi:hypothetical protein